MTLIAPTEAAGARESMTLHPSDEQLADEEMAAGVFRNGRNEFLRAHAAACRACEGKLEVFRDLVQTLAGRS